MQQLAELYVHTIDRGSNKGKKGYDKIQGKTAAYRQAGEFYLLINSGNLDTSAGIYGIYFAALHRYIVKKGTEVTQIKNTLCISHKTVRNFHV